MIIIGLNPIGYLLIIMMLKSHNFYPIFNIQTQNTKGGKRMGVMIDMPAAMVQEANEYAERNGCSFRDLLCLSVEMYLAEQARKRKAEVSAWTKKFNALLDSTESRNDEPYKFNRADAYEPEVAFA